MDTMIPDPPGPNQVMNQKTIDDITVDAWFEKIKAAGYEPQTDYVWTIGSLRSFLFYDPDGNLIQLIEGSPTDAVGAITN
jgi:hypothetical protein